MNFMMVYTAFCPVKNKNLQKKYDENDEDPEPTYSDATSKDHLIMDNVGYNNIKYSGFVSLVEVGGCAIHLH
uniref:Uncharacterized protein n=1 Tax=Rhizophagus irregularis (strain DAOM 181602 / DAOM 197198 / MUCL 43194) TaxID=747089 RepID=U9T714_RHIID